MRDNRVFYFVVVFTLSLFISTFTLTFAQTPNGIYLNSEEEIFKNHSIIIDIIDSNLPNSSTPPVTIDASGTGDSVTVNALYNGTLNGFRAVIAAKDGDSNPTDNIIQAHRFDEITISSPGFTNVTRTFQTENVGEPPNNRTKITEIPNCNQDQYNNKHDDDGDGLCDEWEQGAELVITDERFPEVEYRFDCTMHGNDGCDPETPDVFLEIDWIDNHKPDSIAIQDVINAFANAQESSTNLDGIRLHVQVDPNVAYPHTTFLPFPGANLDGLRGFEQLKEDNFGTKQEQDDPNWPQAKILKHFAFHYTVFAHKLSFDEETTTGAAEIIGNDFIVTLAKHTGKIGSTDQQEGTLMHELGHNLGLTHFGGNNTTSDEAPNKPNLFSVMTYTRQFSDYDKDRVLDYSNQTLYHHHTSPIKDPENYAFLGIDENALKERLYGIDTYFGHDEESIIFSCPDGITAPMGQFTGKETDWNCDGEIEKGKWVDHINNFTNFPDNSTGFMGGHNDWANLIYNFSSHPGNYETGRHESVASDRTIETPRSDPDLRVSTTGRAEIDHEIVTMNRISSLLALYRAVDMLEEDDFSGEFSYGVNFWAGVNNTMIFTQSQQNDVGKDSLKEVIFKIGEFLIPDAFADHATASVSAPQGTSVPGCETTNECFIPYEVTVDVGGEVTWSNDDSAAHTVTAGSSAGGPSGVFDSSLFMAGTTFSHTFDTVGDFPYFCMVHPWMLGTVSVVEGYDPTPHGEPKKDSFKQAIRQAIDLINHYDLPRTKAAVIVIESELMDKLTNHSDANSIGLMTSNLLGTYDKAIGWATHSLSGDDVVVKSIINQNRIEQMINAVENHVDNVKTNQIPACGYDFEMDHGICQCKNNEVQDIDEFCHDVSLPGGMVMSPYGQDSLGIPAENIVCNHDKVVIVSNSTGDPACVESESGDKLIGWGWGNLLVLTPIQ